jgi:hypothetical protein
MGGGPNMRSTAYEYLNRNYQMAGLSGVEACTERRWFALRNFHMQYYEDSHLLNEYLHYWRTSLDEYWQEITNDLPFNMRLVAFLARRFPAFRRRAEQSTYALMKEMVEDHKNGTAYWYNQRNDLRISAFYNDYASYEEIPSWEDESLDIDPQPAWQRLDHGYDETKTTLTLEDLQSAARFRGGQCLADEWHGDLFTSLDWKCAAGHRFISKPNTILKAGHWCPECMAPPWDFDRQASENPFFAQVWHADHEPHEDNFYPEDSILDISNADREWTKSNKP